MDTDDVLQAAGKCSIVDFEATSEIESERGKDKTFGLERTPEETRTLKASNKIRQYLLRQGLMRNRQVRERRWSVTCERYFKKTIWGVCIEGEIAEQHGRIGLYKR